MTARSALNLRVGGDKGPTHRASDGRAVGALVRRPQHAYRAKNIIGRGTKYCLAAFIAPADG